MKTSKKQSDLYLRGIFIQRQENGFKKFKGFCITFPRLGNLKKGLESEVILPVGDFKTFQSAMRYALTMRESISFLRECPIVNHCDYKEKTAYSYTMQGRRIA